MLFKKKKEPEPEEDPPEEESKDDLEPEKIQQSGDASSGKLTAEVDKLKAQFSSFYEMQKASTERFSRLNEQIGELRAMIIERDKDSQRLEAKALQAIDLVESVQPDKLMTDLRKSDSKMESLKANIESNETIMHNVMSELKEIRDKMGIFRGMEEVVKLNEEVKKDLMNIKKTEAVVERYAGRVETIFAETKKELSDVRKFISTTSDLDQSFKKISSDFDSIQIKLEGLANKKEVENLINKFNDFEKHATSIINLMNKKFEKLEKSLMNQVEIKFEDTDKLVRGFRILAEKTPDLNKYFNLLEEEAKKQPIAEKVEKIKTPGEEEEEPVEETEEVKEKKGLFSGFKNKLRKKEE